MKNILKIITLLLLALLYTLYIQTESSEFIILFIILGVISISYQLILPIFKKKDLKRISILDIVSFLIGLAVVLKIYWGTEESFSLIFFDTNYFIFYLVTYTIISFIAYRTFITKEFKKKHNETLHNKRPDDNIVPDFVFKIWEEKELKKITTDDIFKNKKIILFAVPGAFTPKCSSKHLPDFENKYEEFKKNGIDEVVCISVNDSYVMDAWKKSLGIKKVLMLPDGNGDFTFMMNMLVEKFNLDFGLRSWRYSMYIDNKEIKKTFSEIGISDNSESDPLEISDAETMLKYIKKINIKK